MESLVWSWHEGLPLVDSMLEVHRRGGARQISSEPRYMKITHEAVPYPTWRKERKFIGKCIVSRNPHASTLHYKSIALHFVPMGAHLIYIGHPCRPNGRPWTQNVGPCYKEAHSNYKAKIPVILYGDKSMFIHDPQHGKRELPCMRISLIQSNIIKTWIPPLPLL